MPLLAKEFSALAISRLTQPGHHAVGGVSGLYLYVLATGARSWVLRVVIGGRRRHIGLGSYPSVPLAAAKEKARDARQKIEAGIDPIAEKHAAKQKIAASRLKNKTFAEALRAYIDAQGAGWKNPKHRAQWSSTLETYACPVMGELSVDLIAQEHILAVLEPIWKTKTETASRVRGRIEAVLDWATVRKYRSGENPARWKGHLDKLLPAPSKIQKVVHHKALPIDQMPQFMVNIKLREGMAARALEFTILCAARSGETRGAVWDEIDLKERTWIIPGERMKAGKEHRVPLSHSAVALLQSLPRLVDEPWLFSAPRGGQLSDMALSAVMKRMNVDAVPHGFRSTFRDWVGERTNHPSEVAEQALAHTLESKVEAAYRRGDSLLKRRQLMQDWDNFIKGNESFFASESFQDYSIIREKIIK
ncbi:MAG: phage integrase [Polaromonas sp.]|nr:phage integrase [Polaromonas sp.]